MSDPPESSRIHAEVFSRGSLQMTYTLLRRRNPSLALSVRNVLGEEPVAEVSSQKQELYRVTLKDEAVGDVVRELIATLAEASTNELDKGQIVMARSLLAEWFALGKLRTDPA